MKHCEQFIFLSIDRLNQNKNREFCHAMLIYGKCAQNGFYNESLFCNSKRRESDPKCMNLSRHIHVKHIHCLTLPRKFQQYPSYSNTLTWFLVFFYFPVEVAAYFNLHEPYILRKYHSYADVYLNEFEIPDSVLFANFVISLLTKESGCPTESATV